MKIKFALPLLVQLCVISSMHCMDLDKTKKYSPLSKTLNSSINFEDNDQKDTQPIWKNATQK